MGSVNGMRLFAASVLEEESLGVEVGLGAEVSKDGLFVDVDLADAEAFNPNSLHSIF